MEVQMNTTPLNLAAICPRTQALGPGLRSALWVQGCPFRCQGCISPAWIPIRPARSEYPVRLAHRLLSDLDITGITISGGEPILQASALAAFLETARSIREIDVILFTGYTIENLQAFPPFSAVSRLLSLVDVVIDGPYRAELNDNRGLRGSKNQRVIHLTDRLIEYDFINQPRQSEVQITDGQLLFVGIPPKEMLPGVVQAVEGLLERAIAGGEHEWT
jgi:anaerobic ribonucleoside-triphosphate reductase activating protein